MLGKLTLDAVPFHDPIIMVALGVTGLAGLALAAWITRASRWTWLWKEWLTSVDHKNIGIMYIILAVVMPLRGFSDALMMRLQQAMATAGAAGYLPPEHYDQIFTAHGVIMIFFVAMPFIVGLMNLVVPLQIGARDIAFPMLNNLSFWLTAAGAVLINISFRIGEFAKTGWLAFPPLSGLQYSPGVGVDYYIWSLQISGVGMGRTMPWACSGPFHVICVPPSVLRLRGICINPRKTVPRFLIGGKPRCPNRETQMIRFASRRSALRGVLGLALIPAGLAACARNGGMVVPHAQGEARLSAPPRRIVSYDLGALDMLQALGAGVAAVPAVRMPSYLSGFEADTYPRVGTLFEPDLDALRAARPDLILVGGRSSRQLEELSAIAPTLDLSARPTHFLADVERNLRSLGQVLGREAEAEGLLAAFAGERAALHARSAGAGTGLMLFVAGQGMSVQPPGGRFGYLYDLFGIRPVVAAEEAPAAPARAPAQAAAEGSPEAAAQAQARREAGAAQASFLLSALRRNPDWIFALDRPAATGGEAVANTRLAASEAVRGTTAWRRQQVVMLDAPAWYLAGNGITALRSAVAQFSRALG